MWKKRTNAEHQEHVDPKTGMHIVHLHNPDTGAEHMMQFAIGHDACHHCGHAVAKTNLDELDPKAHIASEIAELNLSHANLVAYAETHRLPLKGKK